MQHAYPLLLANFLLGATSGARLRAAQRVNGNYRLPLAWKSLRLAVVWVIVAGMRNKRCDGLRSNFWCRVGKGGKSGHFWCSWMEMADIVLLHGRGWSKLS